MFILVFILLITILVRRIIRQYSYWSTTNIPHLKPELPFGVLTPFFQRKRSVNLIVADIYKESTGKILGLYFFYRPTLLIRDAQLARQILTSEFSSFHDRGLYVDEAYDPLSTNLFALPGRSWRTLHDKLTPLFTSCKLKGMFETIDEVGDKLVNYLNKELENKPNGKTFEFKDIMTTYAVDLIGSVIFGLNIDSFANPDNEVLKLHSLAARDSFLLTSFIWPSYIKLIPRLGYFPKCQLFMRHLMTDTIEQREKHKIVRKDLLQLLLQLRNTGITYDDDKLWNVETSPENLKSMSIDMIAANMYLFYYAGTETTSASAAFTLYELSMYPDLLKRAQDDVKNALEKHGLQPGGKFTYDALQDMKFLELCLMESTRKYPGIPFLNRECTQDFTVPDTEYIIKKGTPVLISLFGMHRDPKYFPDPLTYNPDRFLEESKNYDPVAYMPFGEGPRQCIAQRMGKLNSKLAVAKVLANFDIKTRERKECEFEFNVAPVLLAKDGLNIHLSRKA